MRRIATATAIVAGGLLTGLLLGNLAYPRLKRAPEPAWAGSLHRDEGGWSDAAYAPPPPAYPGWTTARPDLDYDAVVGDAWSDLAVIEPPADYFAPEYLPPGLAGGEEAERLEEVLPPPDLTLYEAAAERAADAALATVADAAEAAGRPPQ